ncbi:MAG: hypothetical protein HFJ84_06365 [Clostridiales bacterium]|jgi:hypothetical protein|nr:hypothetical protein [Clostridiales bacterium]
MKKVWLLIIGAALVAASLSACAGSDEDRSSSSVSDGLQHLESNLNENVKVSRSALGVPTYEVTTPVEIRYGTGGNQYVEWFQTTNERVISDLNQRLKEKGYAELKILNEKNPGIYSYDGSTWTLSFNNTRGIDETLVYEMELNLAVPDSETAKIKGFYVAALIDMFNPGQRDLITETLGIYQNKSERASKTMHMVCGNTKYTLKTGEGDTADRLIIAPVYTEKTSGDSAKPAQPE